MTALQDSQSRQESNHITYRTALAQIFLFLEELISQAKD